MNNKDDFLKDLLDSLKAKGFEEDEMRFVRALPNHMREIQTLVENFIQESGASTSPINLEVYVKAIVGMAAQVQAALVVMVGAQSFKEFCGDVTDLSTKEYSEKIAKTFEFSVDYWIPGFLAAASLAYGEDTLEAKRAQIKEALKNAKSKAEKDFDKDSFIASFIKQ